MLFIIAILNSYHFIVQYYKTNNVPNCQNLLSHITLTRVQAVDLILMPCHMSSHWTLLVCRLKEHYWEFYDSLRSSRHRATLQNLVHSHHRMKATVSFFLSI
ncbi:hypothetical protein KSP40_PGU021647 [Platanthera guangdongensis]|uniref:Ubiquitin-like protease family profile domain-containing protein n=1 Tax=Platanthera guangdongensis TaxID=2320717 RepID=A0ABR2MBM5_9ASPA